MTFKAANALDLPFEEGSFDVVWTQHVAMNIADRPRLYSEMHRVLKRGDRLALYDAIAIDGKEPLYPVPWARDPVDQLFDERRGYPRGPGEEPGSPLRTWRDVSEASRQWFAAQKPAGAAGRNWACHLLLGPDFRIMAGNFARNVAEGRVGLADGCGREELDTVSSAWISRFQKTNKPSATRPGSSRRSGCCPRLRAGMPRRSFPRTTLREAAALGFGGIYVKRRCRRQRLSRFDAALIMEELAAACPSTAAYISIHNMAAWMIDGFGDDEQRKRFLPKLCSMEHFASYCLTEPGAGFDAAALATRAELQRRSLHPERHQGLHLGRRPQRHLCRDAAHRRAGAGGVSTLVVEAGTPGLSFGKQENKLGWNSQPTAAVIFDNCKVPVANRLGPGRPRLQDRDDGSRWRAHQYRRLLAGRRRACLETASRYVVERKQFGKPIADFQATQFKLADMATELDAARLMIWRAASLLDARSHRRQRRPPPWASASPPTWASVSSTTHCNCMADTAT